MLTRGREEDIFVREKWVNETGRSNRTMYFPSVPRCGSRLFSVSSFGVRAPVPSAPQRLILFSLRPRQCRFKCIQADSWGDNHFDRGHMRCSQSHLSNAGKAPGAQNASLSQRSLNKGGDSSASRNGLLSRKNARFRNDTLERTQECRQKHTEAPLRTNGASDDAVPDPCSEWLHGSSLFLRLLRPRVCVDTEVLILLLPEPVDQPPFRQHNVCKREGLVLRYVFFQPCPVRQS